MVKLKPGTVDDYLTLSFDEGKILTTGPAPYYPLSQSVTVNKGYEYKVYMECDNGYQKIYHPIELKQTSMCKTSLRLKKGYDKKATEGFKIPYSTNLRKIIPTVWN
jgi:hypothetical protein